jgi:methionyl-tRNA formyltransferase
MRFAFAGDRDVAVEVLKFIRAQGYQPQALLLSGLDRATHAEALIGLVPDLPARCLIRGDRLALPATRTVLRDLDLDLIIAVHFPYIIDSDLLQIPRWGVVNLHPAFLPFNRGWHTPSWAILEGTPYGATLHLMSEQIDAGDIVCQQRLEVRPEDTADSLYARVKQLEMEVFREAWPLLVAGIKQRTPQTIDQGTVHRRHELAEPTIARLDLDAPTTVGRLIDRLRALTTNRLDEAAWFEQDGRRYRVQIRIVEETDQGSSMT